MNSLTCSGYNSKNLKISFQCDADSNIQLETNAFVGNLMISKKNYSTVKLNIFPKDQFESKNIDSNHSIHFMNADLNDKGIKIRDKECWTKVIDFFTDVTLRKILNYVEPFNYLASILIF